MYKIALLITFVNYKPHRPTLNMSTATVTSTSPIKFEEEINDFFGEYIIDGRVVCTRETFETKLIELVKSLDNTKSQKPKRKAPNYMVWLNKEKRSEIKDEFFSDFESITQWDEDVLRQYYEKKNLSVEKLETLIEKKKAAGKQIGKPRIMALITMKAGLIWSEMSQDEKNSFSSKTIESIESNKSDPEVKENNTSTKTTDVNLETHESAPQEQNKSKAKKGRPAGYKPKNYSTDEAVTKVLESVSDEHNQTSNDDGDGDGEQLEVTEFVHDNTTYFKDDQNNVYNEEYDIVGKIDEEGNVEFSK